MLSWIFATAAILAQALNVLLVLRIQHGPRPSQITFVPVLLWYCAQMNRPVEGVFLDSKQYEFLLVVLLHVLITWVLERINRSRERPNADRAVHPMD